MKILIPLLMSGFVPPLCHAHAGTAESDYSREFHLSAEASDVIGCWSQGPECSHAEQSLLATAQERCGTAQALKSSATDFEPISEYLGGSLCKYGCVASATFRCDP